jgi:predicted permease
LIIAAGYAWRFFDPDGIDRHRARHALSVAVLHFFLPAMVFGLVSEARFDRTFVIIPLTGLLVIAVGLAAAYAVYTLVPRWKRMPRPTFAVLLVAAAFGNVTFLGLPVITETLGPELAYTAILYDLFASTPLLFTAGVFIAARYGGGKTVSPAATLKRVLSLPPLWAAVAGIAVHLTGVAVPRIVTDTATLIGKAVVPIMIFTVGLALDFRDVRRLPTALPAIALKLLLAPFAAWWIGSRLGLSEEALKATTILGAMPVMVISLVIADEFDLDAPLAAMCITTSTILLFFTMPLVMKALL